MDWLIEPFELAFQQRALLAGALASVALAVVGTWVVIRGMAFLGDALAHGVVPGIALALLLDVSPLLGAAAAAGVWAGSGRGSGSGRRTVGEAGAECPTLGNLVGSSSPSIAEPSVGSRRATGSRRRGLAGLGRTSAAASSSAGSAVPEGITGASASAGGTRSSAAAASLRRTVSRSASVIAARPASGVAERRAERRPHR